MSNKRKILKIAKGEYLLDIKHGGLLTTYNIKVAMDITNWNFNQFTYIVSNLRKLGYPNVEAQWIDLDKLEEEVVEETVEEKGEQHE